MSELKLFILVMSKQQELNTNSGMRWDYKLEQILISLLRFVKSVLYSSVDVLDDQT